MYYLSFEPTQYYILYHKNELFIFGQLNKFNHLIYRNRFIHESTIPRIKMYNYVFGNF